MRLRAWKQRKAPFRTLVKSMYPGIQTESTYSFRYSGGQDGPDGGASYPGSYSSSRLSGPFFRQTWPQDWSTGRPCPICLCHLGKQDARDLAREMLLRSRASTWITDLKGVMF